jgi:hypothetical protein
VLAPITIIPRGISYQLTPGGPSSGITASAYIEEMGEDTAQISDHPVEEGSTISDNIIDLPQELTIVYGWDPASQLNTSGSPSFLRNVYASLIALKVAKVPFTVYTGKRIYTNMVFRAISMTGDKDTENSLIIRANIRQLITVSTSTFTIPVNTAQVANPQTSLGTTQAGNQNLQQGSLAPAVTKFLLSPNSPLLTGLFR